MNIRDSKKIKFLVDWRQDHLAQMHWALTYLKDYVTNNEKPDHELVKNMEDYVRWCGQRAFELKAEIAKLERA